MFELLNQSTYAADSSTYKWVHRDDFASKRYYPALEALVMRCLKADTRQRPGINEILAITRDEIESWERVHGPLTLRDDQIPANWTWEFEKENFKIGDPTPKHWGWGGSSSGDDDSDSDSDSGADGAGEGGMDQENAPDPPQPAPPQPTPPRPPQPPRRVPTLNVYWPIIPQSPEQRRPLPVAGATRAPGIQKKAASPAPQKAVEEQAKPPTQAPSTRETRAAKRKRVAQDLGVVPEEVHPAPSSKPSSTRASKRARTVDPPPPTSSRTKRADKRKRPAANLDAVIEETEQPAAPPSRAPSERAKRAAKRARTAEPLAEVAEEPVEKVIQESPEVVDDLADELGAEQPAPEPEDDDLANLPVLKWKKKPAGKKTQKKKQTINDRGWF
jgi:hypothetical protein